jgi:type II secretory pathway pseudopilin PulG
MRRRQEGFSLIEVIIAIGVFAGVILSIASMFILGGRQVKTGKTLTEATTLANDLMEQFDEASYVTLYTSFGAATTDTTVTIASTTTGSLIAPWQAEILRKLSNGSATARLDAMGPGSPNFGASVGVKVTLTLTWNELGRAQSVQLSTVRF